MSHFFIYIFFLGFFGDTTTGTTEYYTRNDYTKEEIITNKKKVV